VKWKDSSTDCRLGDAGFIAGRDKRFILYHYTQTQSTQCPLQWVLEDKVANIARNAEVGNAWSSRLMYIA
jgi:hypothetical protein